MLDLGRFIARLDRFDMGSIGYLDLFKYTFNSALTIKFTMIVHCTIRIVIMTTHAELGGCPATSTLKTSPVLFIPEKQFPSPQANLDRKHWVAEWSKNPVHRCGPSLTMYDGFTDNWIAIDLVLWGWCGRDVELRYDAVDPVRWWTGRSAWSWRRSRSSLGCTYREWVLPGAGLLPRLYDMK